MPTILEYELYCETEDTRFNVLRREDETPPTECPNNAAHPVQVQIVRTYSDQFNVDAAGHVEVARHLPVGSEEYGFSWNFCDESAWPEDAILVEDFELRDKQVAGNREWDTSPDGIDPAVHINWIDILHGRIPFEDERTRDYNPITGLTSGVKAEWADYVPVVKVLPNGQPDLPENWVTKAEDTDFYIDYNGGEIVFTNDLTAGDRVKATFRKSCGSYKWTFAPPVGTKVIIEKAEAHGTTDFVMTGWVRRSVWVYNPQDLPNKVVVDRKTYKRFIDLGLDCVGAFPPVKAIGGSEKIGQYVYRGLHNQEFFQLPFTFLAVSPLLHSQGAEYVVTLDKKWGGTFANIVLYCKREAE